MWDDAGDVRIAVLGAGAMGSLFGAWLAEAGRDVVLLDVPGAQLDALRAGGVVLTDDRGTPRVAVPAGLAAEQEGACDLLLVFTKGMHTRAAAGSVAALLHPGSWVVTLQNGLGNAEAIGAALPGVRLAVGMTSYPADLPRPGHVTSRGGGAVRLWPADGRHDPAVDHIAALLDGAGLHCTADPAVAVAIWEKVAFNAALNALCAVTRLPVSGIADRAEGRALADAVVAEALAVARAQGLAVDGRRVAGAVAEAYVAHRHHAPSMLQDVLAGRPLETETINGAVVAAGASLGVPTPVNAVLRDLLRLIDPGLSAAEAPCQARPG